MQNQPSFTEYARLMEKAHTVKDFVSETSEQLHADLFQRIVEMSKCGGAGIIEVGCFKGASSVLFAYLCQIYNWPFYVIDVNADYLKYTENLLQGLGLKGRTFFHCGTLKQFAAETEMEQRPVMVFVDGDHHYSAVLKDIEATYFLNQRPYAIAFHDFSLRYHDLAHKNTLVDRAIQDCLGRDLPCTRIGVQFGKSPVPSRENPGPGGEYWERHGTEGVIVEISNRELKRSYSPEILTDEADVILGAMPFFRLRPSPDLRDFKFLPYRLAPARNNLCGIVLVPAADCSQPEGELGIEIVSPENQIICQATASLQKVKPFLPVRFDFSAICDSARGTFEIRVFVREAQQPVRVFERRFLGPLMGFRRWRATLLCGMIFNGSHEGLTSGGQLKQ